MVKNYDDMLSCFHLIPKRYWQTDIIAISISRVSVLMREKKVNVKRYTLQQKFSEVSVRLCEAMGFQQPSSKLSTTDG